MLLSEFLADFPDLDVEAGRSLADLSAAVLSLDRKGSLTVTVGLEKKNQRVMTQVNHSAKPPKLDPEAGLYFVHPEKGLTKEDPWQTSLDDLDPATGELKNRS